VAVVTPPPPWRGTQLSIQLRAPFPLPGGCTSISELYSRLQQLGVVCGLRQLDILRVAFAPLYCTFAAVEESVALLQRAINSSAQQLEQEQRRWQQQRQDAARSAASFYPSIGRRVKVLRSGGAAAEGTIVAAPRQQPGVWRVWSAELDVEAHHSALSAASTGTAPSTAAAAAAAAAPAETTVAQAAAAAVEVDRETHERLIAILQATEGVGFEQSQHPPCRTSEESAAVRGATLGSGAKAMLCVNKKDRTQFVLAVMSAEQSLDWKLMRKASGVSKATMATLEECQRVTGCQPGAVPPFVACFPQLENVSVRLIVDESLRDQVHISLKDLYREFLR